MKGLKQSPLHGRLKAFRLLAVGLAVLTAALVLGAFLGQSSTVYAADTEGQVMDRSPPIDMAAAEAGFGLGAWTVDIAYDPSIVEVTDCTAALGSSCNSVSAGVIIVTGATEQYADAALVTIAVTDAHTINSPALVTDVFTTDDDTATLTITDGDSYGLKDGTEIGHLKNGDGVIASSPTTASEATWTGQNNDLWIIGAVLLGITVLTATVITRYSTSQRSTSGLTTSPLGTTTSVTGLGQPTGALGRWTKASIKTLQRVTTGHKY